MFSNTVVCTDKFYNLPLGAQALYFQLGMTADDDGFVSSPLTTMRIIGCNSEDLTVLINNDYIIPFESGVIVIADWKRNNTLKSDRYVPTEYTNEFEKLKLDGKKYRMETKCFQNVSADKYSIDKYSIDNTLYSNLETKCFQNVSKNQNPIDYGNIINMYNSICVSLPKVAKISDARKKAIKARLKTYTLEDFESLFKNAESSSFLTGANDKNWTANFDWLIKDSNMAKVLDGNYNKSPSKITKFKTNEELKSNYGNMEDLESRVVANKTSTN
jgi:hypothetical protein